MNAKNRSLVATALLVVAVVLLLLQRWYAAYAARTRRLVPFIF